MRLYDVSAPLRNGMPVWPGDPRFRRTLRKSIEEGDEDTVSELAFGAHTGTHVDAPSHFVAGGGDVGSIPLEVLIGPVLVVGFEHVDTAIGASDLEAARIEEGTVRLLAKTSNSGWSTRDSEFQEHFVAFDSSAADWCVERGVRLLGIDYLSIEPYGEDRAGHPVHRRLLGAEVVIVEGLDLVASTRADTCCSRCRCRSRRRRGHPLAWCSWRTSRAGAGGPSSRAWGSPAGAVPSASRTG